MPHSLRPSRRYSIQVASGRWTLEPWNRSCPTTPNKPELLVPIPSHPTPSLLRALGNTLRSTLGSTRPSGSQENATIPIHRKIKHDPPASETSTCCHVVPGSSTMLISFRPLDLLPPIHLSSGVSTNPGTTPFFSLSQVPTQLNFFFFLSLRSFVFFLVRVSLLDSGDGTLRTVKKNCAVRATSVFQTSNL
ncbi:hypothetical protein P170DRAFT_189103 [Aspergillus steynii IBT 23096]|uniref:Uncharacterized protein n=1 Tax=Aspergillus steynii IBT 23096 TaxID=1392250 RepID=A0A2I2G9P5_9EURO|nr:uncharacterized protein P170DRAFT_189103 [Aspergillus steynii IBT 23096]PLB49588.1 hypothetical protein P170DRAFT_189103 [Aspergillus steynii IBT 23096]